MEYKYIDVIRHAEAAFNRGVGRQYDEKAGISTLGRRQVQELTQYYKSQGIVLDHVLSSPLRRAKKTAKPLPRKQRWSWIEKHPGLAEPRWGSKIWGQRLIDLPEHPNGQGNNLYSELLGDAGQEPYEKVVPRVQKAVERLLSVTKPGEITAAVCHGSVARLLESFFVDPTFTPTQETDVQKYGLLPNARIRRFIFDKDNNLVGVTNPMDGELRMNALTPTNQL